MTNKAPISRFLAALALSLLAACSGGDGGNTTASSPDFTVSITQPNPLQASMSGTATVTATRIGGHTAAISLSLQTNTQGITGNGSVAAGENSGTLTISVPSGVAAGNYALTMSGSDASLPPRTAAVSVAVTAAPVPDFNLSVPVTPTIQAGSSGSAMVNVVRTNGHDAVISLSLASNIQGITGSGSIAAGENSGTLTLSVPATVAAGNVSLIVQGTDASQARTAALGIVVTAGSDGSDVTMIKDIVFATINGRDLKLDLYLIDKATNSPLIVTIHAGGFSGGNKNAAVFTKEYLEATKRGYAVASVEYRLSGEAIFPAAIQDVKGAVRWLKANSQKYGIDKNNVFAIGGSAGGSLSALLGTSWNSTDLEGTVGGNLQESSRVNAVVDLFGPVEFEKLFDQRQALNLTSSQEENAYIGCDLNTASCKELSKKAGAINHIDQEDPPFYILHGGKDAKIPINQSIDFNGALINLGVESTFVIEPNMGHGGAEVPAHIPDYLDFFDRHRTSTVMNSTYTDDVHGFERPS